MLLHHVQSRLCRINQEGLASLTPGCSTGWKTFCNITADLLTQSRAGESAGMSTPASLPRCSDGHTTACYTHSQQAMPRYLLHKVSTTVDISSSKHLSGQGCSHPLITRVIIRNGCFPVASPPPFEEVPLEVC